jgi:hypothetical protein
MREIRTSGSEGGVGLIPHPYLYPSDDLRCAACAASSLPGADRQ